MIVSPLHDLTSIKVCFHWSPEAQAAFEHLKERFTAAPILTLPDPTRQFIAEVDASSTEVGAALSQRTESDNKIHPCPFFSHQLSPAECKYDIRD